MKYSVLIITLNEEKYIGKLLDSLVAQTFKDFEVIVVDARSHDKTRKIVESYLSKLQLQLFFIETPKGPSYQRNVAASKANTDKFMFFDADTVLEPDFISKVDEGLTQTGAEILTTWNKPISKRRIDKLMYLANNIFLELIKFRMPGAVGTFIYSSRKAFETVKGFDEKVNMGEDFDFTKRAFKAGFKYVLLHNPKILFSVRRLDKEGRPKFIAKQAVFAGKYLAKGSITDLDEMGSFFKHEFGKY